MKSLVKIIQKCGMTDIQVIEYAISTELIIVKLWLLKIK